MQTPENSPEQSGASEPAQPRHFDVAIIGGGPAGYSTALRAAELGKSVALIEEDGEPGGVCLHAGCVPSKALLTAANTVQQARHATAYGLNFDLSSFDLGKLVTYKRSVVNSMTSGLTRLLQYRKVTMIQAAAEVPEAGHVVLRYPADMSDPQHPVDAHSEDITAADIVLATGSRPRSLPGVKFSHKAILDSTDALNLLQIPQSVIIIGSGSIGLEFATLWRELGADVTVLEAADQIFPAGSKRSSAFVTRAMKRSGTTFHAGVRIQSVTEGANLAVTVRYECPDVVNHTPLPPSVQGNADAQPTQSNVISQTAQFALVCIGRVPNTDEPWFSQLGVELDERGYVKTDPYGRTNIDHVWALGDITAGKQLAHRAFAQGIVVAESIAGVSTQPVENSSVPAVVYSQVPIASVGINKETAQSDPDISDVQEVNVPIMGNARVQMVGGMGNITIVSGIHSSQPGVRVILGIDMCGPGVEDLAGEAAELVGNRVPLHEAARLIHPHPTFSETLGEALLNADGRPLHTR